VVISSILRVVPLHRALVCSRYDRRGVSSTSAREQIKGNGKYEARKHIRQGRRQSRRQRQQEREEGIDLASNVDMGNVSSDTRSTADIVEAE